jgi:hypothetical protein
MASPAIVGSPAETAISTANTSHVVNLPSGTSGNMFLAVMSKGSQGTTPSVNSLTGWNELLDEAIVLGLYIAWKAVDGTEGATTTFTLSSATRGAWVVYEISGATTSPAPQVGTTATGSSVNPNPPSVTVTGGSKDILAFAMFGMAGEQADDDTLVTTFPTNYTDGQAEITCGVAGTNLGGMCGAAARQVTTSAEDPGTFTAIDNAAWRAQTIVVHPYAFQSKTITEATETDEARPVSYTHRIVLAAETDTAVALSYGSVFSIGPAAETDWTNSIVPLQPFPASETDTTLTRTRLVAYSMTTVTETDSAVAVTYAQASDYDLTFATETDTAVALTVSQPSDYDITTATELDAAQALTQATGVTINAATETDLINSIVPLRVFPASETDTAVETTVSEGTYYNIVTAAETDAAQALTKSKSVTLTTATETDAAQALTFAQASDYNITLASETDLANSIVPLRVFPASETDTAQTVSVSGGAYSIVHATETDSAQARTASKAVTLPEYEATPPLPYNTITIGDTSTAVALSIAGAQSVNITAALETDAPQALTYSQAGAYSLAPALETDTAGTLRAPNLTTATETDTTVAVTFTKTIHKTLVTAAETDTAQPVTYSQSADYSLAPGGETDSAGSLRVPRLVRAAETDLALSVTYSQAGAYSIAPALETDSVQTLVVPQTVSITTAGDTSAAVAITSFTAVNLIRAVETSSGVALTVHKAVTLGHAAETDQAVGLPYGGAYDILTASETDTATTLLYAAMPPSGSVQTMLLGRISRTRTGRINRTKQGVIA